MTTTSTRPVMVRLRTEIADLVKPLAQRRGVTESRLIEELLREESRRANLADTDPDNPNEALELLLAEVKKIIEPWRGAGVMNADAILYVFNQIKVSPELLNTYQAAVVPPPNSRIDDHGRRQSINQQIARFVKTFLGMQSDKEVAVRDPEALIKSYTKLKLR